MTKKDQTVHIFDVVVFVMRRPERIQTVFGQMDTGTPWIQKSPWTRTVVGYTQSMETDSPQSQDQWIFSVHFPWEQPLFLQMAITDLVSTAVPLFPWQCVCDYLG